jgi:hypothetical protein
MIPLLLAAAVSVWAIDDGEKIKEDATSLPFERGEDNPIWKPGGPIKLVSMKNETVAFQVIVEADEALEGVTVDLASLVSDQGKLENGEGPGFVGKRTERFVEHYFDVPRPSGGAKAGESLGWMAGSGPAADAWTGRVPDALIPVESAPAWSPYPMKIAARKNGAVWIDVTVPKAQPAGLYAGKVIVKAKDEELATLPIELQVVDAELPDRTIDTMVYYERASLQKRIGDADAAERQIFQLFHRHRLVPMHGATKVADVERQLSSLDGSLYTREQGYEGPGEGTGDNLLSLGSYGAFRDPDAADVAEVEKIAALLAEKKLSPEVFVYAIDEQCSSTYGADWKKLLSASRAPKVKVGWTCSDDPEKQPVDITMLQGTFDPPRASAARAAGKDVWVYNGVRPKTGAFLTDTEAVSPRVNGWLGAMFEIGRWFYWESTFWYDGNRGGKGPYDPFVKAETFHNQHGDWCMGDGVLVYPGKQVDMFTEHSVGVTGVLPSIRLKNWRRGVQDAGYYLLARAQNAAAADAIAKKLLPRVLAAAKAGEQPSWSPRGEPFFKARIELLDLGPKSTPVKMGSPPHVEPGPASVDGPAASCGCRGCGKSKSAFLYAPVFVAAALFIRRGRRSRRGGG